MNSDSSTGSKPRILICKCGAAGDVLRTTPLLEGLNDAQVDWFVNSEHAPLLQGSRARLFTSFEALNPELRYDVVISLEESPDIVTRLMSRTRFGELIGTYISGSGRLTYTDSARAWFDMSLISRLGAKVANRLKFENRRSYQDLLFSMVGLHFCGEAYYAMQLGEAARACGILLAPGSGIRWPSKRWAFYGQLAAQLRPAHPIGWLNQEPSYKSLAKRIARFATVVANDSLPLHVCLSLSIPVCGLFTCTSPWEIHDYGLLTKVTSSRLQEFYYSKELLPEATQAISVEEVLEALATMSRVRVQSEPRK
jgi:heptosyltransferase II